jgi:hypothetical protein
MRSPYLQGISIGSGIPLGNVFLISNLPMLTMYKASSLLLNVIPTGLKLGSGALVIEDQSVMELFNSDTYRAIALMRQGFGGHPFGKDDYIVRERKTSRAEKI